MENKHLHCVYALWWQDSDVDWAVMLVSANSNCVPFKRVCAVFILQFHQQFGLIDSWVINQTVAVGSKKDKNRLFSCKKQQKQNNTKGEATAVILLKGFFSFRAGVTNCNWWYRLSDGTVLSCFLNLMTLLNEVLDQFLFTVKYMQKIFEKQKIYSLLLVTAPLWKGKTY